jgi:DnaJ-class molecular chaperone
MKHDCYICGGDGFVSEPVRDTRSTGTTTRCPGCDGSGKTDDRPLPKLLPVTRP